MDFVSIGPHYPEMRLHGEGAHHCEFGDVGTLQALDAVVADGEVFELTAPANKVVSGWTCNRHTAIILARRSVTPPDGTEERCGLPVQRAGGVQQGAKEF